uniref:Uncharacterized protein n=1 Tax=Aegilops tauschii subsp. strangulata TaxID=200361 RepID=A0A453IUR3_AEGTS
MGCQVPGLLQHNDCVQPLSDRGGVPWLPDGALPTHRRKGEAHRGMLLPPEGRLSYTPVYVKMKPSRTLLFKLSRVIMVVQIRELIQGGSH